MRKTHKLTNIEDDDKGELLGMILFIVAIFVTFMPIIFNYIGLARWAQVILPIISAIYGIIILGLLILTYITKTKKDKNVFIVPLVAFSLYLVGLLGYFDYRLWGKREIIISLTISILFIIGMIFSAIKYARGLSKEKPIRFLLAVAFLIAFIASIILTKYSNISIILYKIAIGIFYLFLLAKLVNAFVLGDHRKPKEDDKYRLTKVMVIMIVLISAIIMLPFYIKWCINNDESFNIILIIYASVISGSITLGGVAWTIRNQNEGKLIDQIKSAKPYLKIIDTQDEKLTYTNIGSFHFDSMKDLFVEKALKNKKEIIQKVNNDLVDLSKVIFKNTDNASFIFNGIVVNGALYSINNKKYVEKNEYIIFKLNDYLALGKGLEQFIFVIEDVYNKKYHVKANLKLIEDINYFQTTIFDEKKSDYKRVKIDYSIRKYSIEELCIPELAPQQEKL